jgi:twitching motility two-component system response regulator PilG
MRLEFESNTSTLLFAETESSENAFDSSGALNQGIEAARDGDRTRARALLLRVTENEPRNEEAWMQLASISEYPEELMIFLSNALDINPRNELAAEWMKATKSLLAATFVERGIEAAGESRDDFARQCFYQAVAHDPKNEAAWFRLASISATAAEKQTHLARVLAINPENADARAVLKFERDRAAQTLLRRASTQALNGERAAALDTLNEALRESPQHEDALILKAHLTDDFAEKIKCYENVLETNPANEAARVGLSSLNALRNFAAPIEAEEKTERFASDNDFSKPESEPESDFAEFASDLNENPSVDFKFEEAISDQRAETVFVPLPESANAENGERETEFSFGETVFEDYAEAAEDNNFEVVSFNSFENFGKNEQNLQNELEIPEEVFDFDAAARAESVSDLSGEIFDNFNLDGDFTPFADVPVNSFDRNALEEDVFASNETAIVSDFSLPTVNFPQSKEIPTGEAEQPENDYSAERASFQSSFNEETEAVEATEFYAETDELSAEISQDASFAVMPGNSFACPFCNAENDVQSYACRTCRAVLSLSEMEMLLANENADRSVLERAVERMEEERNLGDFGDYELMSLGIGHINLKNWRRGFLFLQQASKTNPNNVILSSQVNALALRLEEIERRKENSDAPALSRTILVVDDSATVRKLISGKLEKSGHEVVCAVDGMDALAKLDEAAPDLILLDITMPRMDGYQVCKMIRSNPVTKNIPVVMISGKDGFFDKVRGRMAGTTGYITKPFGPETLMKALDVYIKNTHEQIVACEV